MITTQVMVVQRCYGQHHTLPYMGIMTAQHTHTLEPPATRFSSLCQLFQASEYSPVSVWVCVWGVWVWGVRVWGVWVWGCVYEECEWGCVWGVWVCVCEESTTRPIQYSTRTQNVPWFLEAVSSLAIQASYRWSSSAARNISSTPLHIREKANERLGSLTLLTSASNTTYSRPWPSSGPL